MPDPQVPGPKTGHRPPHKTVLKTPQTEAKTSTPAFVDHSPWAEGRFIGTGPHRIPINIGQQTLDAEAFVAPHDIDFAIKGLPPKQRQQIHDALRSCLDSPEACDEGFGNEIDLAAKAGPGFFDPAHRTADRVRADAGNTLKYAQSIVAAEKQREAEILSDQQREGKILSNLEEKIPSNLSHKNKSATAPEKRKKSLPTPR